MTKPVYKVETLTGAVSDHIIENEVASLYFKDILTDGVGTFSFMVPTKKNGGYYYDDIALNDKVKIWLAYDSVGANPNFIGKIYKISAPLSTQQGYVRVINGLSQGEVLLRRFKENKYWLGGRVSGTAVSIVDSIADDLSLGKTDIASDATTINHEVRAKTYFDVLRDVADWWVNAGSQLKYDFYVDTDNDLVWKARPIRTAGVETFTVGDNILSYNVIRDLTRVKNNITVYGAAEKPQPSDNDGWTESSSGDWTLDQGTVINDDAGDKQVGANSLNPEVDAAGDKIQIHRAVTPIHIATINELHFWRKHSVGAFDAGPYLRLYAPDNSNYFEYTWSTGAADAAWREIILTLGAANVYDAATNPTADWHETGTPNWWAIEGIEFYADFNGLGPWELWLDGLYLFPDRWSNTASDATSQSNYGRRDLIVKDDKLHSDSDCQKRSETMLYQLKDPPTQINAVVPGNDNVLIGDRLPMTIPAEGISAANYDVIIVENWLNNNGWTTRASMVDSANTREAVTQDGLKMMSDLKRELRELGQDFYRRIS